MRNEYDCFCLAAAVVTVHELEFHIQHPEIARTGQASPGLCVPGAAFVISMLCDFQYLFPQRARMRKHAGSSGRVGGSLEKLKHACSVCPKLTSYP